MDYAFAPGQTRYDREAAILLAHRPETMLIRNRGMQSVMSFFQYLGDNMDVQRPVRNIFIASHFDNLGILHIDLDGHPPIATTYEDIAGAVARNILTLPNDLRMNPSDGSYGSCTVKVRCCSMGREEPIMLKLKEAFGTSINVNAPRHVHVVNNNMASLGFFEYLKYDFQVSHPTPLSKPELVAACQARSLQFEFLNGQPVPDTAWAEWLPENTARLESNQVMYVRLGQNIGHLSRIREYVDYLHRPQTFPRRIEGVAAAPASNDLCRELLVDDLQADPAWASHYDYPIYLRMGFISVQDCVNGFSWRFNWRDGALICMGIRHLYALRVPITSPPSDGDLLFNFYPAPHTDLSPVLTLWETDDRLFRTV